MIKANVAIHKDAKGDLSLVVLSADADKAIDAVKECGREGEIGFFRLTSPEKSRKIPSGSKPAAKKAAKKAAKE